MRGLLREPNTASYRQYDIIMRAYCVRAVTKVIGQKTRGSAIEQLIIILRCVRAIAEVCAETRVTARECLRRLIPQLYVRRNIFTHCSSYNKAPRGVRYYAYRGLSVDRNN